MLNLNSLYNGDCLEVMNQIDDKSIDFMYWPALFS